jgi:hypothetical protein
MTLRTVLLLLTICCMGFSCGSSQELTAKGVAPEKMDEALKSHVLSKGFFKINCDLYYQGENLPFSCYRYGSNPDVVPLFIVIISTLKSSNGSKMELFDNQGANPDAQKIFSSIVVLAREKFGESSVYIK